MGHLKGKLGFQTFYQNMLGNRWPNVEKALLQPAQQIVLINPASTELPSGLSEIPMSLPLKVFKFSGDSKELRSSKHYLMDLASVLAVSALPKSDTWVDLCAAPGGKTLARIYSCHGELDTVANEMSPARMKRLRSVLKDHLPAGWLARVRYTQHDASRLKLERQVQAALVDAPCSGERHLLNDPRELEHWSEKRSHGLAIRQHSILCNALELIEDEGHILYSTCSLSPIENDEVISKLLKKRRGRVEVLKAPLWLGERTQHGVQVLPDHEGWGPIYYCLLQKVPTEK